MNAELSHILVLALQTTLYYAPIAFDGANIVTEWFPGILTAKAIFKETSNDSNDPKADQQIKNLINENFKRLWAEIYWKNGRVSYVPLNDLGEAVSYDRGVRSVFTITFQSDVDDYGHAADIIYLKE